jgi:hypothetical protein
MFHIQNFTFLNNSRKNRESILNEEEELNKFFIETPNLKEELKESEDLANPSAPTGVCSKKLGESWWRCYGS